MAVAPLAVTATLVVGTYLAGPSAARALRLEASRVGFEPWRLLTGHLVHLTWQHALLNLGTLALFVAVLAPLRRPRIYAAIAVCAALTVAFGILRLHPQVPWYVGFSGVLYGLIAGGGWLSLRETPAAALVLVGLAGKLTLDRVYGTPATTEALVGGSVLDLAHVYGAAGGMLAAIAMGGRRPTRSGTPAVRED